MELSKILSYSDGSTDISYTSNTFWIIIRKNCSYFWNKMFIQFLGYLHDTVDYITEYDETTISIRIKKKK